MCDGRSSNCPLPSQSLCTQVAKLAFISSLTSTRPPQVAARDALTMVVECCFRGIHGQRRSIHASNTFRAHDSRAKVQHYSPVGSRHLSLRNIEPLSCHLATWSPCHKQSQDSLCVLQNFTKHQNRDLNGPTCLHKDPSTFPEGDWRHDVGLEGLRTF